MADFITRAGAEALIPVDVSREILSGVSKASVAMQLMRRLADMPTGTRQMPVLSALPIADFVNGDAGMKVHSDAQWSKRLLVAGEIATIVPIPEAVLDDSQYDIWEQIMPAVVERFGRVFDNQVFGGGNPKAPAEWPQGIIAAATAAEQVVAVGTGVDALADVNELYSILEDRAYAITGIAAQPSFSAKMRGLRTSTNEPIYQLPTAATPATLYGVTLRVVSAGVWDKTQALAIAGDWDQAVFALRQDITIKRLTESVISNDAGAVVLNFAQQDMVGFRATMRLAWQIANPVDIDRPAGAYPFAILAPEAPPAPSEAEE
jgi:HK97 family phage major capsid protein